LRKFAVYRDQKSLNEELRKEIVLAWPRLSKKKLSYLLPPEDGKVLTILS